MAAIASRYKGVTPPISTTLPTAAELKANDDLIEELKNQNNFEGTEVTERRYDDTKAATATVCLTCNNQEENLAVATENHSRIRQGRTDQEKQAAVLHQCSRRKDFHLRKLPSGRIWSR